MSSWYFRSAPRVSAITCGESWIASRATRHLAQSIDFGDAGLLEQVLLAQPLHEGHNLAAEGLGRLGGAGLQDGELAREVGVVDPVVEAAALQRVVHLAGAVGGQDHDRRGLGVDGAELGDRHLEVAEGFEQEGFEGLVGAVELVDQEHRGAAVVGLHRLEQRAADQEALGEELLGQRVAVGGAFRLGGADRHHLGGEVPLVDGAGGVEALVALQADQPPPEREAKCLGDLGFSDAGLAFEKERPAELQREVDDGGEPAAGDVAGAAEQRPGLVDRARQGLHGRPPRSGQVICEPDAGKCKAMFASGACCWNCAEIRMHRACTTHAQRICIIVDERLSPGAAAVVWPAPGAEYATRALTQAGPRRSPRPG